MTNQSINQLDDTDSAVISMDKFTYMRFGSLYHRYLCLCTQAYWLNVQDN